MLPTLKTKLPPALLAKKDLLLSASGAFLLSAAPLGELHPFGLALLCACRKHRLPVLCGVLLAIPFCGENFALQALCAAGCYLALTSKEAARSPSVTNKMTPALLRSLLAGKLAVREADALFRTLTAFVTAAVGSLFLFVGNGFSDGLLLALPWLALPLFAFLFDRFFAADKLYELSLLGLAFAATQIFLPIPVYGVPLSLAAGTVFTLAAGRTHGFAFACAAGLLCGLTAGGGAVGALGVTGITYGLLAPDSETLALILSYMISVAGLWYLSPADAFLPGACLLLLGTLCYLPLRKKLPQKLPARSSEPRRSAHGLSGYAAAFSSLSGLFYTVSENATPVGVDAVVRDVRRVVSAYCKNCEGCDLGEGELCACFTDRIREKGIIRKKDIPLHILSRCPSVPAMARTLNELPESRTRECEKGIRRMAAEYAGMSALLEQAARTEEESTSKDRPAAAAVKEALKQLNIPFSDVVVTGKRILTVEVFGVRISAVSASPKSIALSLGKALGRPLSEPEFSLQSDLTVMKLISVPCFRIEYATCSEAKAGEPVGGDTVSFFETGDGRFYCLLSDGMGSGRDAALTSRLAAIMLEKLLTMGADKAEAIRMLNKALLEKEKEVFTTVDLLEIDRYTGVAVLIKAGAAPTLLLRNGICRRFESKTPPAGILKDVIAEKRTFRLQKGDLLLMLSDGVLQTGDPPAKLPSPGKAASRSENAPKPAASVLTALRPSRSAHAYAHAVLSEARSRTGASDDMSVCTVRIV